ncbi:hypothetical protein ACWXWU_19690 [Shewanella sp. A14]
MEILTASREASSSPISMINLGKANLFKPVMAALITHVLLIFLIAWFWYQDTNQRKSTLVPLVKSPAIKSYLITSYQYELMRDSGEQLNKAHSSNPQETSLLTPPKISPDITSETNSKKVETPIVAVKKKLAVTTLDSKESSRQSGPAPELNTHSDVEKPIFTSHSIKQISKQYIQQHNDDELERLISSQTALTKKPSGTMSEMDPQLDFIVLEPDIDISQPHTFDHKLDPNRIVKQGDYCYRVVELPTQINPHGHGLGFAEFCGEDKQKKQLTKSINNRINKLK